ncbi:protein kintoun-like [Neocloeon triangulifer]|uniref:protein kintoun-like n=1 Tax=Neocloeon triangulifer TaxID=2078957 RepID=UPI00286F4758|nr:protein kintoun-like [Neocloeon triangulifer]
MSQTSTLRTVRVSRVQLGTGETCENLKNWLMNSETSCPEAAARASNPALVEPEGRYVLKVWTQGREKVMINICTEAQGLLEPRAKRGSLFLPHSVSKPRQDVDLKKQPCLVVDVTFGQGAVALAEQSDLFRHHLHQAALNASQTALGVTLQRDRVATPKLQCKGDPEDFRIAESGDFTRVEMTDEATVTNVSVVLPVNPAEHRVKYSLTREYLEVDLKSHSLVLHLPSKVQGLKEEPLLQTSRPELNFRLLKTVNKAAKAGFFLVNQPVSSVEDQVSQKIDMMDIGSSGGSDEEKVVTQEQELFISRSQNNNTELKSEPSDTLDNQSLEERSQQRLANINKRQLRIMAAKTRSISESSDDWSMCHSPCKGILKSSFSISGDLAASYELSDLNEETSREIDPVNSVKKSVSFSDVISKQLFRADSSILGQRKKNQRKARNKRKATQRKSQTSESEDVNSEAEAGTPKEGQDMMFDIDM